MQHMDGEHTRASIRMIADIVTALELRRAEIDDIRRELMAWSARLKGAANEQERDATMLAFTRYMKNEIVYEPCYARARGTAAPMSRNQTPETGEIQWVDKSGNPTPDDNPAIGWVRGRAHERVIWGRLIRFEPTLWSQICAEHAKRLPRPAWSCGSLRPTRHNPAFTRAGGNNAERVRVAISRTTTTEFCKGQVANKLYRCGSSPGLLSVMSARPSGLHRGLRGTGGALEDRWPA